MMPHHPSRRDVLRLSAAAGATLLASGSCARRADRSPGAPSISASPPDFTVAFLTDMHVHDQRGAPEGFAKALRNALDRPRPPEVLVTGGDLVMDILATGREEADAQYALFDAQLADVRVPVHHTMGNHDLLGVYESSGLAPDAPGYGKRYYLDRFARARAYGSFDHDRWHFVILDSLAIRDREYVGWIDREQRAWLEDDLATAARPTVVFTHIPLWSNYVEMKRGTAEGIPGGATVINAHEVAPILQRHPVKLVLAGHLHVNESFTYKGIEYATVGAVSGNWWDGPRDGFEEGYGRLEFRGDRVSWHYVDYGWEAEARAEADAA